MKKVAINGFGRIGRLVFRQLFKDDDFKIVAVNDLTSTKVLAHLLKYDSSQGRFEGIVKYTNDSLVVNGQSIKVFSERDPLKLPWKTLEIEAVVEATGLFRTREGAKKHLDAGAKKILISAPGADDIKTIVYSVNENILTPDDDIVSAASCTTNALAPVLDVLQKNFGIEKGFMTTVHAYTADQRIVDGPHGDLRRARAAAANIVPTSTGAAAAIGKVIPELTNRLDGIAMRVPVLTGSVVDLVVELSDHSVTRDQINDAMRNGSNSSFEYIDESIVSSDIIGTLYGSIFDSLMTQEMGVEGKKLFKLIVWYDNESSYVAQYVRTFKHLTSF